MVFNSTKGRKMKTRERIKRIRKAKHWFEKSWLAQDVTPGTDLDMKIVAVCQEYEARKNNPEPWGDTILDLGFEMAKAVRFGNSALFRQWANAIDAHKNHEPFPDKLRAAISNFCVPSNRSYAMRGIIQHLRELNLISKTSKESVGLADIRRNVRRICRENGITIKGKSGRPKN
jgi:hypothetical protein